MSRFLLTFGLVAAMVAGAGYYDIGARAEDKKGDKKADKKAEPRPAETKAAKAVLGLAAAYTLVDQGREAKSPLLLLAAARVIGLTDYAKFEAKDVKMASKASDSSGVEEAEGLIKEAEGLAGDDATVKAVAAKVRAEIKAATRGAIGGPKSANGVVDAGYDKEDGFYCDFVGGQPARVTVFNTTGAGDIDLYVYDLEGRLVAQDRRAAASAQVFFYPPRNSRYEIKVRAYAGNRPLHYRISTN